MNTLESHPLNFALAPFSFLYAGAMRARRLLYARGVVASHRLAAPVISIGNLTTGGTGKTPLVRWLVERLHPRLCDDNFDNDEPSSTVGQSRLSTVNSLTTNGARHSQAGICILTRGYGRSRDKHHRLARVVVSDGVNLLAGAATGGDEPRQLAEQLLGQAAVISDVDRVAAARWASENLHARLFILDDGFQHLRVHRDFNIVAVNALNPFGNRCVLPRGRLREPLAALHDADALIVTRAELLDDKQELHAVLNRFSRQRPVYFAHTQTRSFIPFESLTYAPTPAAVNQASSEEIASLNVLAFCGLAEPQSFFEHLARENISVVHRVTFSDHHAYTASDIADINLAARRHRAQAIVTTMKDAVKLHTAHFDVPCFVLDVDFKIDNDANLLEAIENKLQLKT